MNLARLLSIVVLVQTVYSFSAQAFDPESPNYKKFSNRAQSCYFETAGVQGSTVHMSLMSALNIPGFRCAQSPEQLIKQTSFSTIYFSDDMPPSKHQNDKIHLMAYVPIEGIMHNTHLFRSLLFEIIVDSKNECQVRELQTHFNKW